MVYDILIIGSGPAGVTAAIYAARSQKSALVIEKESFGGLIIHSPKIENYPGFNSISGLELADKFVNQAMDLGVVFEFDEIKDVKKVDGIFSLTGEYNTYEGRSLIICTGSKHRKLNLPLEDEFTGHGISYCAVCDGPFYTGKDIVIVGGGNSAMQEAILLSSYCKTVTMVQNLDKLTGESASLKVIENTPNINVLYSKKVVELKGENKLTSIVIEDQNTKKLEELTTDGVFVAIGQVANNEVFKDICELDEYGFIITDELCQTKTTAVFAAGDCRKKRIRQISTAIADGTISTVQAIDFLENN